jgi:hypothetical protein
MQSGRLRVLLELKLTGFVLRRILLLLLLPRSAADDCA